MKCHSKCVHKGIHLTFTSNRLTLYNTIFMENILRVHSMHVYYVISARCTMPLFAIDASLRSSQEDASQARRPQSFELITILSLQPVGSRGREERLASSDCYSRLLLSPCLVAVGLSEGWEIWPLNDWHQPFVIGWTKYTLG